MEIENKYRQSCSFVLSICLQDGIANCFGRGCKPHPATNLLTGRDYKLFRTGLQTPSGNGSGNLSLMYMGGNPAFFLQLRSLSIRKKPPGFLSGHICTNEHI
ncbi:MAG: hypothetical protein DRI57_25030 [Deltaproteobacteria bacterium]|nr:MAG: hypothetical protein DRI57_25030 [Deltaproteobacteria bacterium]